MTKHVLTQTEIAAAADCAAGKIAASFPGKYVRLFGVPRGGIPAAYAVQVGLAKYHGTRSSVVGDAHDADVIVDDLVDSGATRQRYEAQYPNCKFVTLFNKAVHFDGNPWLVFPWEISATLEDESAHDVILRTIEFIGEDPKREGLVETPRRVVKAWTEWFSGYKQDPKAILKTFADGALAYDEMVLLCEAPFYSHCEHHMAPFFGHAWIGYIPDKRIVGLSKLKRLLDVFSRRLQVQERLTNEIAGALEDVLQPKGVAVLLKARHMCMESRGVRTAGAATVTSDIRGAIRENASARQEFFQLCCLSGK